MLYLTAYLIIIIAYLIGSISSSVIISKKISGEDIRNSGSGNAGATNMLRVHGKKAGIITLLCDVLKGVIAVGIGVFADYMVRKNLYVGNSFFEANILYGNLRYIGAVFVVLGHDFPVFFKFKGGKGIATSLGVMLMLDWKIGLIVAVVAILIMAVSRYVSLGSVIGAIIYPVAVLAFMAGKNSINWVYVLSAVILGLLAVWKHQTNIKRLMNGTENKLFSKKQEVR